ncbi:hypothetical protein [Paenibacillus durus]|nr:hypothetical protein [Paenibacillus durus]
MTTARITGSRIGVYRFQADFAENIKARLFPFTEKRQNRDSLIEITA